MRIAVAVVGVLALAGCVVVPPPGPTDAAVAEYNAVMLDKSWANTGLDGAVQRPAAGSGAPLPRLEWFDATFACMANSGIGGLSVGYTSADGYTLYGNNGPTDFEPNQQLAFYRCAAEHPVNPEAELLTDDQLNYIYDYYLQALVPCMVLNGFPPSTAPTRVEFFALAGQWSPYYSVDVGLSGIQYEEIEQTCGPERPQLYG